MSRLSVPKPISLFGSKHGHFPVPANFRMAAARSGGPGRRRAPARTRLALDGREHRGSLPFCRTTVRLLLKASVLAVVFGSRPADALAEPVPSFGPGTTFEATSLGARIDAAIAEASPRFRLPEAWLRAILQAESAGDPRALSRAGAIGLMQLMPRTWLQWRARLALGPDPFDVHDNIIAGAAYARELLDAFGVPGFVAAYNAGPGRYAEHLATGRDLPPETRAYLARLAPRLRGHEVQLGAQTPTASASDWRWSSLFTAQPSTHDALSSGALFVPRSPQGDAP
jgi:soluble lytic murein transglycosylase-like protein